MVLGDSGAGKSQLFQRLLGKPFNPSSKPTAGIDFGTLTVKIASGKMIKAQIVDTSGLERFRSIIQSYWNLATGAIIVYDVTSMDSFNAVRKWVRDFKSKQGNKGIEPVIMIVGNKVDRAKLERQVPTHEAQAYALAQGFLFMETSASENRNVDLAFNVLLTDIYYSIAGSSVKVNPPQGGTGSSHPVSPQPRSSSLQPSEMLLSPPNTPDSESGPRHRSFDERLFDQAKAFFSWMGSGEGSFEKADVHTGDSQLQRKEREDNTAQTVLASLNAKSVLPEKGKVPESIASGLGGSVASAIRGRLGSIGYDGQLVSSATEPAETTKLSRSQTMLVRPSAGRGRA
ncbi:hypothetical protein SpCBS45565_g05639 [Spizellomyces sp. 'palustris']|nr:hypothetical protein SpCBS45565_g05639 [Spizellomyces sp. 'palustris']